MHTAVSVLSWGALGVVLLVGAAWVVKICLAHPKATIGAAVVYSMISQTVGTVGGVSILNYGDELAVVLAVGVACTRRLIELTEVAMRAHVGQMPSSAVAREQRCHAAEDALQLLADRLQTYQPHYPAVDRARGAVLAARATRGAQRRSSALSVDNARALCPDRKGETASVRKRLRETELRDGAGCAVV